MRIQEMRQREDIDAILRSTLSSAWSTMLGQTIQVVDCETPNSQTWQTHRLLGGFFTKSPHRAVRHFLRDGFRSTAIRRRIFPQWVLGTQLSTKIGLRLTSTSVFGVQGMPSNADSFLVLPGNQRVRIFDFSKNIVRVVLKDGYSSNTMKTEIDIRAAIDRPFILPVTSQAEDISWFEETIFEGYTLPRCPPWFPRQRLTEDTARSLENWSLSRSKIVDAVDYSNQLRSYCLDKAVSVQNRFDEPLLQRVPSIVENLFTVGSKVSELFTGPSHGDFQPGNILISKDYTKTKIIDWEHFATRSSFYDRMVLGLSTRSPLGLTKRWFDFLDSKSNSTLLDIFPRQKDWRRSATAIVALEDLIWYLEESLSGPYFAPSPGLLLQIKALDTGVLFQ